jgi:hypothetical protein
VSTLGMTCLSCACVCVRVRALHRDQPCAHDPRSGGKCQRLRRDADRPLLQRVSLLIESADNLCFLRAEPRQRTWYRWLTDIRCAPSSCKGEDVQGVHWTKWGVSGAHDGPVARCALELVSRRLSAMQVCIGSNQDWHRKNDQVLMGWSMRTDQWRYTLWQRWNTRCVARMSMAPAVSLVLICYHMCVYMCVWLVYAWCSAQCLRADLGGAAACRRAVRSQGPHLQQGTQLRRLRGGERGRREGIARGGAGTAG